MGQDRKSKRERKSVEIPPIINKPKHPKKKREHKEQSERTHSCPRRQKNHLRGPTTRGTSSSQTHRVPVPPPLARSISNKERGGLPERKRHEEDTKQKEGAESVHKYQTDIHIHNMPNCGHKGFYLGYLSC
jgi:hypothetical protein